MKLSRSTFLLLAAAVLVAGVGVWYALGRKKSAVATVPSPSQPVVDPSTGPVVNPSTGPVADPSTVPDLGWEGGEDDNDNPIRYSVPGNYGPRYGTVRIGSATNPGMLNLVLVNNTISNGRGQVVNTSYVSPNARYLIDDVGYWQESLNGLWFGIDWPHTIEVWEVDPGTDQNTWRVDGTPHAQTVFTIRNDKAVYDS